MKLNPMHLHLLQNKSLEIAIVKIMVDQRQVWVDREDTDKYDTGRL